MNRKAKRRKAMSKKTILTNRWREYITTKVLKFEKTSLLMENKWGNIEIFRSL